VNTSRVLPGESSTDRDQQLVKTPMLKRGCIAYLADGALAIEANENTFRCQISNPSPQAVEMLNSRPRQGDAMASALASLLGSDLDAGRAALSALLRAGLVVEHIEERPQFYDAEYIGYRLIDGFRCRASRVWNDNPLIWQLREGRRNDLATGFLIETYHIVRGAHWTASAVMGHHLTAVQRQLLRSFLDEEADHSELLAEGIGCLNLTTEQRKRLTPNPESLLFNDFFFAAGHHSPAHFAAALVITEVKSYYTQPEDSVQDSASGPRDLLDLLERGHGVPATALKGFREHAALDDASDHGLLPVQLLAEEQFFTRESVELLAATVAEGVAAYDQFLTGIRRRYDMRSGSAITGPLNLEY